jgi:hypothetical protein
MLNLQALLANSLWHVFALPKSRRFGHAANDPAQVQRCLLQNYLKANQATEYGRRFNFAAIDSVEAYQKTVPLTTYDDYAPAIARIGQGERNVLTIEPVQMFELSSGSTVASKLIPYTATLKAEFQRGLAPWIVDLFSHYPELKRGPAYWSITPLTEGKRTTLGGIPIGFEEDSAYLGALGKLIEAAMAVPNLVKQVLDIATFRYITLLFLLRQPNLRLISVWNPTFLTLLLAPLSDWWAYLLEDIAHGTITPPNPLDPALEKVLRSRLKPDPAHAKTLSTLRPDSYSAIWPNLGLLSCWTDGPAATYAQAIRQAFPGVPVQGKGLIATEAFVALPLIGKEGSALAITSHFFEFLTMNGISKLAHQLKKGETYSVVVTTGGGFYRYQLQDVVEVMDFVGQLPCIRFLGKTDRISDLFGEKLNERFVAQILAELFARHKLTPRFAMLAPDDDATGFCYTLYLEIAPERSIDDLQRDLEQALCQNFHYAYCRKLGQLSAARLSLVTHGAETYLQACQRRGQKLGNIKPMTLDKNTGWARRFAPGIAT